jgi:thiamine-monophosphate kinase
MPELDEFALIRMLTGQAKGSSSAAAGVRVGVGDDAAVAAVSPGMELVLTCDAMVQEVHFKEVTMKPSDIGYKAVASNISDIAAMGGIPRYALVSISIPKQADENWLVDLYKGIHDCCAEYAVSLVGGDTTSSPYGLGITVTLIGEAESNRALLRSSAQEGDLVFLTGPLGRSAAGLHWLLQNHTDAAALPPHSDGIAELIRMHQRPQPQVKAGRLLLSSGLRIALNDISDGLASEAWEISEASGVGVVLDEEKLPVAKALADYAEKAGQDPLNWILYGGEDYQLLGTIPAAHAADIKQRFAQEGLIFYEVGTVTAGPPEVRLRTRSGAEVPVGKKGYNHFT